MSGNDDEQEKAWSSLEDIGYPIVGMHLEGALEAPDERTVIMVVGEPPAGLSAKIQTVMGSLRWRIEQVRPNDGVFFGG